MVHVESTQRGAGFNSLVPQLVETLSQFLDGRCEGSGVLPGDRQLRLLVGALVGEAGNLRREVADSLLGALQQFGQLL